jgi:hypothetical protein
VATPKTRGRGSCSASCPLWRSKVGHPFRPSPCAQCHRIQKQKLYLNNRLDSFFLSFFLHPHPHPIHYTIITSTLRYQHSSTNAQLLPISTLHHVRPIRSIPSSQPVRFARSRLRFTRSWLRQPSASSSYLRSTRSLRPEPAPGISSSAITLRARWWISSPATANI